MKILAIESSCDDTAAAVTEERRVLSSVVASQVEEHRIFGGVVPEIASRRHSENIVYTVNAALEDAGVSLSDIRGGHRLSRAYRCAACGREFCKGIVPFDGQASLRSASPPLPHRRQLHFS